MGPVAVVEETRTCRKCERTLPLVEFALAPRSRGGRETRCRACVRERKRRIEADDPFLEAERLIRDSPDPTPAANLRVVLGYWRKRDIEFAEAWRRAVSVALGRVVPSERPTWREAFEATRGHWRAAYEGRPSLPGTLDRSLCD
jgi:hypothetical protein